MNPFTQDELEIRWRMRLRQMETKKPFVYYVAGINEWCVSWPVVKGFGKSPSLFPNFAAAMAYVRSEVTA